MDPIHVFVYKLKAKYTCNTYSVYTMLHVWVLFIYSFIGVQSFPLSFSLVGIILRIVVFETRQWTYLLSNRRKATQIVRQPEKKKHEEKGG